MESDSKLKGVKTMLGRATMFMGFVCAAALTIGSTAAAKDSDVCVGGSQGCFATIQAAVDAAQNGDTIQIGPGTFAGGITIDKSIQLVGAGATATIVRGGGPVVTIGDLTGATTPTVSIGRVTITGGVTHSSPGGDTAIATGGGVLIPGPSGGLATGAIVTISDSIITGNTASPLRLIRPTVPPGPPCGTRVCSFALGGGIENAGTLTLTDTQVTDNVAGSTLTDPSVTTDASGGGINSHPGATLTLRNSVVSGNRVAASGALAQSASGGGISDDGVLTIEESDVSRNTAELSTSFPGSIFTGTEPEAEAGGINITTAGMATIVNSTISHNITSATSTAGDVNADTGGIDSDGSLTLSNSKVEDNQANASVPPGSGFGALALGGGLEVEIGSTTVNNSSIDGNSIRADSATGLVAVNGAGIMNENGGQLTLHNSDVFANHGSATGAFGFATGGGITNFAAAPLFPPAGPLTLINSRLTKNVVTASPGIAPMGGGLFTADVLSLQPLPAKLIHTVIAGNSPDQCFGC